MQCPPIRTCPRWAATRLAAMQGQCCFAKLSKPSLHSHLQALVQVYTINSCTCSRVAWLDEHPPELALTPSPAVPCSLPPATCLPQLQPVPAQQSTAVAAPTGSFPQPAAALPLQPCHLPHALPLVQSTTSASSSAVTHRAQGHGLPPIPGPSTQTSWSPHKGQKIALSKEGKKDAGVRPGKQQGQRQAASRVPRDRANKGGPVWNSDFSIQYEEPLSMKDQERVLKHAALGRFKQPHASAACREQSAGVVMNKLTSVSPSMWPPLSKVTQHPAVLQNSRRQQTTSATCHRSKAAARSQSGDGAHMDSAVVEPRGREQSKGRACNNKLRGGSIAYSRNLDSAQSPLRSAKGLISDGEAALCNLNKFCFLPFQVCCKHNSCVSSRNSAVIMVTYKRDHCCQVGDSESTLTSCDSSPEMSQTGLS